MKKLVIGLTGGIGTGKSLALKEFARRGASTISLDRIAREVTRKGGAVQRRIARAFGLRVLGRDGSLDRSRLAELVFARPLLRRRLEGLTHPSILREMCRRIRRASGPVVVVDVPLLFEGGHESRFDLTLAVTAKPRNQAARVLARDGLCVSQARRRMAAQWPSADKEARADLVVANDGSRADFLSRIGQYQKAFALMAAGRAWGIPHRAY